MGSSRAISQLRYNLDINNWSVSDKHSISRYSKYLKVLTATLANQYVLLHLLIGLCTITSNEQVVIRYSTASTSI